MKKLLLFVGLTSFLVTATPVVSTVIAQDSDSRLLIAQQPQITEQTLREFAEQANQQLPMNLNSQIRWDSVAVEPQKNFIFNYTFLDPSISQFNATQINQMKEAAISEACKSEQIKVFLSNGVTIVYRYHESKGKKVAEVKINPSDCR